MVAHDPSKVRVTIRIRYPALSRQLTNNQGVVQLVERLVWDQEVESSRLFALTIQDKVTKKSPWWNLVDTSDLSSDPVIG